MPLTTMLGAREIGETLHLLARRLDCALAACPAVHTHANDVRRQLHVSAFRKRLRAAQLRRTDPYIDVARVVRIPTSLLRRHTEIPGDYYPTLHPGAVIAGDWDLHAWVIEERTYYVQMREALEGTRPWEGTEIHARFAGRALTERRAWRRQERLLEARDVLLRYERIYESMRRDGYLSQDELAALRPAGYKPLQFDEISVVIARDGELQVCQGGHRLAIAKAVGVPEIPVWIAARHAEWSGLRIEVARACIALGGQAPEPLLHPDLWGIPHRHDRVQAVEHVRRMLPIPPATIVDITPAWGYAAKTLEAGGFDCVAVAANARELEMLQRMRRAYGGAFAIADMTDAAASPADAADGCTRVVIALGDLDQHLGSRDNASRLKSLLRACRPKMMIMRGSRAELSFCAEATGLASVAPLPQAGSGIARLS